jgi:hypothetical protein
MPRLSSTQTLRRHLRSVPLRLAAITAVGAALVASAAGTAQASVTADRMPAAVAGSTNGVAHPDAASAEESKARLRSSAKLAALSGWQNTGWTYWANYEGCIYDGQLGIVYGRWYAYDCRQGTWPWSTELWVLV